MIKLFADTNEAFPYILSIKLTWENIQWKCIRWNSMAGLPPFMQCTIRVVTKYTCISGKNILALYYLYARTDTQGQLLG